MQRTTKSDKNIKKNKSIKAIWITIIAIIMQQCMLFIGGLFETSCPSTTVSQIRMYFLSFIPIIIALIYSCYNYLKKNDKTNITNIFYYITIGINIAIILFYIPSMPEKIEIYNNASKDAQNEIDIDSRCLFP